jgi:hypothetical protein
MPFAGAAAPSARDPGYPVSDTDQPGVLDGRWQAA